MIATVFRIISTYGEALVQGLFVTLALCLIVWTVGIILGVALGFAASKDRHTTNRILNVCSFLFISIPFLVLLYWVHFPLQALLHIVVEPFITAAFVLSLVNTIFVAQIVRNVLDEFPAQYAIAGKVCGLTSREIFQRIEFPILFRQLIPQLLTLQVTMLQMTVFASLISVEELFRIAQQINSLIYKPIEIYTTLAIFFIAICLPLNLLAHHLKEHYTRNLSET